MQAAAEPIRAYAAWFPLVRIGVLLLSGVLLEVLARRISRRMSLEFARRGTPKDIDRRRRTATLLSFATSVARVGIWATVLVSLLAEVNLNIGPILAGAGVVGAALAFGAQNIVKDYLAGFFILLEDQYTLGDVIKIGAVSGTVEDITMRITTLRAADGTLHIVPNGTIQTVSNMTCIWANVILDVAVAQQARTDDALAALRDVATSFAQDASWQSKLLGPPEVTGVVALNDASATLRLQVKVIAEEQWRVRFELVSRVKHVFEERRIPFPGPWVPSPSPQASP